MNARKDNRVMVFEASYDDASLSGILDTILGEFPFAWNGKKVLVKPNILAGEPPEKAVTTHPALVKAVKEKLTGKGAVVMVGDNPGMFGYGKAEKAAQIAKITDAAGECFIHLGRNPVKQPLSSRDISHVMIAEDVLQADIVVNLPKLKTHGLTFFTGAVKNTFGYVVGGDKMRVHSRSATPRRFAEALVDIFKIRPPDLNIMDAIDAMEGNGPHNGQVRRVGKVLASDNAVCLDAVAVTLIGRRPESIPHLAIAAEEGLGEIDLPAIRLNREITPVSGFKMPVTFVPGVVGVVLNRFLSHWINCTPEVAEERCKKCGVCVDHCPVSAIIMEKRNYPRTDKKECINCYCCQEMCPEDAIVLKGRVINLLRGAPFRGGEFR